MKIWLTFIAASILAFGAMSVIVPAAPPPAITAHHQVAVTATTAPTPTPSPATTSPVSPHTHVVTGAVRTGAGEAQGKPTPEPAGTWTPYNPHCFADCFPDYAPDWAGKVDAYYAGTLDKPLPPPPLDHYACEYMHIAGYLPGVEQCKGVL